MIMNLLTIVGQYDYTFAVMASRRTFLYIQVNVQIRLGKL